MASRAELESRLRSVRLRLDAAEAQVDGSKAARDAIIRELRALPDPPSARAIGGLAGLSNVQVLRIAEGTG